LFGDYDPAGRLPVTFYKSDNDLPDFSDYSMSNRTYRYFKGEALYPFGYGLSYTTFKYDMMKMPATVAAGKSMTVSARVTNTGKLDGEEVTQMYIAHSGVKGKSPIKALKGFQRISLKAGESKVVSFTLSPEQLSLVNEEGKLYQPNGKLTISIGGGQPGVKNKTTSGTVLSKETKIL
jgi:beta-glucosidase